MANAPAGNIYTAALMQHNAHPDYKYEMQNCTCSHEGVNPSCGDELTLQLRIEGDQIAEASFVGSGCAVSQASADMMADLITGESIEEAKRLLGLFLGMIKGEELSEEDKEDLDEAAELEGISRMPARVKCAELAWRTLEKLLAEK
jgi:nitrogen fixation protein NifU and related proteins